MESMMVPSRSKRKVVSATRGIYSHVEDNGRSLATHHQRGNKLNLDGRVSHISWWQRVMPRQQVVYEQRLRPRQQVIQQQLFPPSHSRRQSRDQRIERTELLSIAATRRTTRGREDPRDEPAREAIPITRPPAGVLNRREARSDQGSSRVERRLQQSAIDNGGLLAHPGRRDPGSSSRSGARASAPDH